MTAPFPELTTARLLLRKIEDADKTFIFEGLSHPEVIKYYGVSYTSLEETTAQMNFYNDLLVNETGIWWAICFNEDPAKVIGACGFNQLHKQFKKIEMGYWLLPPYWGKGIMTEAVPAIIGYAFTNMDIHRIEAVVEDGNGESTKLLQKLHFRYEGTLAESEIKNGQFINLQYWALLNKK